ncbi:cysteine-rich venom protein ENH2-like [Dreissena polymorpha]|uniref:cysteine-rich venom protein ENH2-like n=1 Tax=Dreissena polymorpha TaxID=45954 RepID=UPI0022654567|nr:cysteine-rich venom protein ENH2-like [Dreissena polymorpha]
MDTNNLALILIQLYLGLIESQTPSTITCYSPRPFNPSCTDKYAALPGHLNCEDLGHLTGKPIPLPDSEMEDIANQHNRVRSNVTPRASNMLVMHTNAGLVSAARRWARRCTADSTWYQRSTPGAFIPGQNSLFSPTAITWTDVIAAWEAEKTHFTYGGPGNDATLIGNYTQMISAETVSIGCGAADCGGRYLYICLYVPILDTAKLDRPYKASNITGGCDDCASHCNTTIGLCDFNKLLCLGGSSLNMTSGTCDCIQTVPPGTYTRTICDLVCIGSNDTDPECLTTLRGTCGTKLTTMFRCPWMCNVCPYSDAKWNVSAISRMPWEKGLPVCNTAWNQRNLGVSSKQHQFLLLTFIATTCAMILFQ